MMVAWHEVPGNRSVKIRPAGYGMIVSPLSRNQGSHSLNNPQFDTPHTVPYGTNFHSTAAKKSGFLTGGNRGNGDSLCFLP